MAEILFVEVKTKGEDDAVGDYEPDATVMVEDVPKVIAIKNLKVSSL